LYRDGHKCQHCKGKSKDKIINVHHIESRKTGGDAPNNLITLCKTCHDDFHSGKIELKIKRGQSFRDASHMNIMRWFLWNKLKELYPNSKLTYGYITKNTRIKNGLEKSHRTDARCISGNSLAEPLDHWYFYKQVRCQNRQLHKVNPKRGIRRANKTPRYVYGYQLFDEVEYQNEPCFVFGRRSSGYFDLRKLDGTKISTSANYKKLKLLSKASILLCEKRCS
jgi:N6-L-threonylcarbamoyladenine synthase